MQEKYNSLFFGRNQLSPQISLEIILSEKLGKISVPSSHWLIGIRFLRCFSSRR